MRLLWFALLLVGDLVVLAWLFTCCWCWVVVGLLSIGEFAFD